MPRGFVFFDIDGTLVPSTSSGQFLAERFGHSTAVSDAEERYAAGMTTNYDVSVIDAAGWAGTSEATVERWLEELPLIAAIEDVVAWCQDREITPVLATVAWWPVSESFSARFGFERGGGPRVQALAGVYTGLVDAHFDEYDKRDCAARIAARAGVPLSRCVAIGDSRSDLPLFEVAGHSIALNASHDARAAASVALDTHDLRSVLPYLDDWLAHTPDR